MDCKALLLLTLRQAFHMLHRMLLPCAESFKDLESKEAFGFFRLNRLLRYADFVDNLFFSAVNDCGME
jgi:hypothetical protein